MRNVTWSCYSTLIYRKGHCSLILTHHHWKFIIFLNLYRMIIGSLPHRIILKQWRWSRQWIIWIPDSMWLTGCISVCYRVTLNLFIHKTSDSFVWSIDSLVSLGDILAWVISCLRWHILSHNNDRLSLHRIVEHFWFIHFTGFFDRRICMNSSDV